MKYNDTKEGYLKTAIKTNLDAAIGNADKKNETIIETLSIQCQVFL